MADRETRARRIEVGRCGNCGKRKLRVGYRTCRVCITSARTWQRDNPAIVAANVRAYLAKRRAWSSARGE